MELSKTGCERLTVFRGIVPGVLSLSMFSFAGVTQISFKVRLFSDV